MNTTQIPPNTPQTSPRHPPDISRKQDMQTDNNRRQLTPPDILKQRLSVFWVVWRCLLASVVVCLHVLFPGDVWGVSVGYLGGGDFIIQHIVTLIRKHLSGVII